MPVARLLSDTRLQYRGWPPAFRATIRRSYIGKYNFVLSRVWRCYTPVRTTSSCAKSARILAHVPAGAAQSLVRSLPQRTFMSGVSRGSADPLSIHAIVWHGAAQRGAARCGLMMTISLAKREKGRE